LSAMILGQTKRRQLVAHIATAMLATGCFCCCAFSKTAPGPISRATTSNSVGGSTGDTAASDPTRAVLLDDGFRKLYELNFSGARRDFRSYQDLHPEDPVGKAAEAASYLYEQFNARGVFTSAFFLNDSKFLGGVDGSASENRNIDFLRANDDARKMAKEQLKSNPQDPRALMALTLADGMESDYDALIVKKQMAALGLMRQAESDAAKLLAVDPSAQDAYVALGASNYVIGCLPSFKRAFLFFGGIHGDRVRGMEQMQVAADHGRYLRPFAKILLALACEREHDTKRARQLLTELTNEFPANPLFARELDLLDQRAVGGQ
jgi:hypothetical protein